MGNQTEMYPGEWPSRVSSRDHLTALPPLLTSSQAPPKTPADVCRRSRVRKPPLFGSFIRTGGCWEVWAVGQTVCAFQFYLFLTKAPERISEMWVAGPRKGQRKGCEGIHLKSSPLLVKKKLKTHCPLRKAQTLVYIESGIVSC